MKNEILAGDTCLRNRKNRLGIAVSVLAVISLLLTAALVLAVVNIGALRREISENEVSHGDGATVSVSTESIFETEEASLETAEVMAPLPADEQMLEIMHISQKDEYPNGCEAVSATMVLRYMGFDISEDKLIEKYLKKEEMYRDYTGKLWGPDPNRAYAGDPSEEEGGCGCFAPVIARAMRFVIADYVPPVTDPYANPTTYSVNNTTGHSLEDLEEYIDIGSPVVVWTTIGMREVSYLLEWQITGTDELALYPANEHCVVLIGYDDTSYTFADPLSDEKTVTYSKEKANLAHKALGKQSVVIVKHGGED